MTTKRKEFILFKYDKIIEVWKCEISERKIKIILNHPKTTIHDVIAAYKNFG